MTSPSAYPASAYPALETPSGFLAWLAVWVTRWLVRSANTSWDGVWDDPDEYTDDELYDAYLAWHEEREWLLSLDRKDECCRRTRRAALACWIIPPARPA